MNRLHTFIALIVCMFGIAANAAATDIRVGAPAIRASQSGSATRRIVSVDVSWRNGWRTARNHDGAWLVVKSGTAGQPWSHVRLAATGHQVTSLAGPRGQLILSEDRVGAFLVPSAAHRGDVSWRVQLALDPAGDSGADLQVVAFEMVYIPAGGFTLGDPDPAAIKFSAVYRSHEGGEPAGLFQIASEGPISVGPSRDALFYKTNTPQYEGDRMGPIPAAFPKGVSPFYIMKYELTQGEYAAFLNMLRPDDAMVRAIHRSTDYTNKRGTIRLEKGRYVAASAGRPANFVGWDDSIAFADWAGLRPMTEFEFTKAARGPNTPIAHEFPWGTATADRLKRAMGPDDELVKSGEADESRLTDATRDVLGASFYWVMDLAGSVWEKVITFGHPRGRAFRGSHGDGTLAGGRATNDDWPHGDDDPGGYGYRGGGYYERGMQVREFNPYSPIAYRRYGSWGGGPRSIAYGFRAVRTAPAAR